MCMKNLHNKIRVIMVPNNHEYVLELSDILRKNGVEVYLLPPFHYSTLSNLLKIVVLKRKGYDIIHIQWAYVFPFFWFMKLSVRLFKKLKYKIIFTLHDIHEATIKSKIAKDRILWMYKNSDYRFIHYVANLTLLEDIVGLKPDNIDVIYHPIFLAYKNTISKKEARDTLSIPRNKKVLLSFGKIRRYKGTEVFADALEKLNEDFLGVVVGEPSHKDLVNLLKAKEQTLSNLVIIDKYIPDDEIQIYFNACDVVVLPYLSISTSGVALLAYSFHKPVITTNLGGMPEVVIDGKTGLLIPPNDADALVTAITKIFNLDYQKMGENAYKLAKEKFAWDKVADKTIRVYEKVLKNEF